MNLDRTRPGTLWTEHLKQTLSMPIFTKNNYQNTKIDDFQLNQKLFTWFYTLFQLEHDS